MTAGEGGGGAGDSVDFDKSHSQDETKLPNFSSNLPRGPLTFQGV